MHAQPVSLNHHAGVSPRARAERIPAAQVRLAAGRIARHIIIAEQAHQHILHAGHEPRLGHMVAVRTVQHGSQATAVPQAQQRIDITSTGIHKIHRVANRLPQPPPECQQKKLACLGLALPRKNGRQALRCVVI